jgi:hypothetical protein
MFWIKSLGATFKALERSNLVQKFSFEFHAMVKKCHFDNFSERGRMAVP